MLPSFIAQFYSRGVVVSRWLRYRVDHRLGFALAATHSRVTQGDERLHHRLAREAIRALVSRDLFSRFRARPFVLIGRRVDRSAPFTFFAVPVIALWVE